MNILFAILRKLRNVSIVIAVGAAAIFVYVVLHTGWRYQDLPWDSIKVLKDNLGQPALPEAVRGKFVRLGGYLSPFDSIRIVRIQNESCVILVPADDPSHAAWDAAHRQLEEFDADSPRLQQVADDTAPDAAFEAKMASIRAQIVAMNKQMRPDGTLTDRGEMQASALRFELQESANGSALRRAIRTASKLQSDLTELLLRLSRKSAELMPASGVLVIYRDDGERAERQGKNEPDPFVAGRHLDFGERQHEMRERTIRFAKQTLRIPPTATLVRADRVQLKLILKDCVELADTIRGVLPAEVTVTGRLQLADPELREKFKQLSGREAPRFVVLAGEAAPDRSAWPLLWISGGSTVVAILCQVVLAARKRRMRRV